LIDNDILSIAFILFVTHLLFLSKNKNLITAKSLF